MTDWKVRRAPGEPLTLTIGKAATIPLELGERYALAAALIGHPIETLPGYIPPGRTPHYCGARSTHPAHYWATGTLWCTGDPA